MICMIWNDWDDFRCLSELGFWGFCFWLLGDSRRGAVVVGGVLLAPHLPSPSPRPSPAERERGFCWWLMAVLVGDQGCGRAGGFGLGSLSFCEGALRFLRGAWAVHERPLRVALTLPVGVVDGGGLLARTSPGPSPAHQEKGFVGG